MHIALLTPTACIDGGVAVHVQRSAAALRGAGHDVMIVTGDGATSDSDLHLPGLGATEPLGAPEIRVLLRELREQEIHVAHFHDVDDVGLVGAVRSTAAALVSAHGWSGCGPGTRFFGHGGECQRAHGPLCVPNMLVRNCKHTLNPKGVFAFYRRAEYRLGALRASDVAVAHSRAMLDHLANNQISDARLVPLPVDTPRHARRLPETEARVAYVGRLTPVKGVAVLLRSAQHFEGYLDICGDGYGRSALERLTDRLALRDRVTFHGWCSQAEVESVYDNARVVVVPSLYPEPFGMVGPEAMARGRPVIASSTGGTSDWLDDGETGLAVAPGDPQQLGQAIARILTNGVLAARMGRDGRNVVLARFSAKAHTEAVLAVYREAQARALTRRVTPRQSHFTGIDGNGS